MGVILHAHYRLMGLNGQKIVMPAPVDKNTPHAPWWWDHLASRRRTSAVAAFRQCFCRPSANSIRCCAGRGRIRTLRQLRHRLEESGLQHSHAVRGSRTPARMIGIMHACGLDVYADVVMHQYDGGDNGTYRYVGADGKDPNGRFPKHPSCFVGAPPRVAGRSGRRPRGQFRFRRHGVLHQFDAARITC